MPQVIPARSLELHEVEARFGLQKIIEPSLRKVLDSMSRNIYTSTDPYLVVALRII